VVALRPASIWIGGVLAIFGGQLAWTALAADGVGRGRHR
jgi:hypothetical protein